MNFEREIDDIPLVRAKCNPIVPVVLIKEVSKVMKHLSGTQWLIVTLLYGTGVRLLECIRLWLKNADTRHKVIIERNIKDAKHNVPFCQGS